MGFSYEKRPIKKQKLGPPDVYPQQPKQKEVSLNFVDYFKIVYHAITV